MSCRTMALIRLYTHIHYPWYDHLEAVDIELIKNNARVGGQIAVELSKLRQNYRG